MSLASNLTLDDASGDDVSFVLTKNNSDGTIRIDSASTLSLPYTLAIKHSTSGKGAEAIDRHLVQFAKTVNATPVPVQVVANFTLAVARNSALTQEIIFDVVANMLDFLMSGGFTTLSSTANLEAVLRGES